MPAFAGGQRADMSDETPSDRLDSWKEIGAYLKRDVRTLRRWEKDQGLPVHRHQHKSLGSVYAFRSELDAWWANGERQAEPVTPPLPPAPRSDRSGPRFAALAGLAAAATAIAVVAAWRAHPATATHRPSIAQATFNSFERPVSATAISPDGKYLVYVDPAGIALQTTATGEARRLPGVGSSPISDIAWLPDSTTLIAAAQDGLWRTSIFGDTPRRIANGGGLIAVSTDGTRIAVTPPGNATIRIITAEGEQVVEFALPPGGVRFSRATWSPDGSRIAYQLNKSVAGRIASSLETRKVSTGAITTVFEGPVQSQVWAADGQLIFARPGSAANPRSATLWQVAVDPVTGAATSAPLQVSDAPDMTFIRPTITRDGRTIAYSVNRLRLDVYSADLQPATAELRDMRRAVPRNTPNTLTGWTPHGDAMLFVSPVKRVDTVFREPLDVSDPIEFLARGAGVRAAVPSPDSQWIYYLQSHRPVLERVPAGGGTPEDVFPLDDPERAWLECSHPPANICAASVVAGDRIRFLSFTDGRPPKTMTRDMPAPLSPQSWDISPDGLRVAAIAHVDGRPQLVLLDLGNGAARRIDTPALAGAETVAWIKNGNGWIVSKTRGSHGGELLYVDGESAPRRIWQSDFQRLWSPKLSPDGRHVAFSSAMADTNVWTLQRF